MLLRFYLFEKVRESTSREREAEGEGGVSQLSREPSVGPDPRPELKADTQPMELLRCPTSESISFELWVIQSHPHVTVAHDYS